jgi:hypothetical protein
MFRAGDTGQEYNVAERKSASHQVSFASIHGWIFSKLKL